MNANYLWLKSSNQLRRFMLSPDFKKLIKKTISVEKNFNKKMFIEILLICIDMSLTQKCLGELQHLNWTGDLY